MHIKHVVVNFCWMAMTTGTVPYVMSVWSSDAMVMPYRSSISSDRRVHFVSGSICHILCTFSVGLCRLWWSSCPGSVTTLIPIIHSHTNHNNPLEKDQSNILACLCNINDHLPEIVLFQPGSRPVPSAGSAATWQMPDGPRDSGEPCGLSACPWWRSVLPCRYAGWHRA